jgi:hypothetical protein
MSKITKTLADEIANKLVQKLDIKIEDTNKQFRDILYSEALKQVPEDVLSQFYKDSTWVKTSKNSYFTFGGVNHVYYYFDKCFPCKNAETIVVKDADISDKLTKLHNKLSDLSKKRKDLIVELTNTLLKLGTYNRVRESFPEAAEYLSSEAKMELAINIQDTRDKLKSL